MAKTSFTPPKGYQPPEDVAEGSEFDESATFKYEGEKLCLVAINGQRLPGYEDKDGKKAEPPQQGFAERVAASIVPQQPQSGGY